MCVIPENVKAMWTVICPTDKFYRKFCPVL